MKIFGLVICLVVLNVPLCAGDLDQILKNPDEELSLTPEDFLQKNPSFKWLGINQRVAASAKAQVLTKNVQDALVYFDAEGKISRVEATYYDVLLHGKLFEKDYEKKCKRILAELKNFLELRAFKRKYDDLNESEAYRFKVSPAWEVYLLCVFRGKAPGISPKCIKVIVESTRKEKRVKARDAIKFIKRTGMAMYLLMGYQCSIKASGKRPYKHLSKESLYILVLV